MTTLDVKTAARLTGKSDRWIRACIANGELPAQCVTAAGGNRGMQYVIPLDALPAASQLRYAQEAAGAPQAVDLVSYRERYGEQGLRELNERLNAVKACKLLEGQRGGVLERKKEIAEACGVSLRRLYEWVAAYEERGISGLMNATRRADAGRSRSMCMMAQDYITANYCASSQVGQNRILYNLRTVADKLGTDACDVCPHNPDSLNRCEMLKRGAVSEYEACDMAGGGMLIPANRHAVNRFILTIPAAVRATGRKGWAYWEAHYQPKALRAKPERTNEVWFGDHHVFDLFVLHEGKPVRPWLTAWMDAASNCIVGWALSLNPNSDTIVEALTTGIDHTVGSPFYGTPMMLYIDNGKDYRCKRLEGTHLNQYELGRLNVDFEQQNALLETLGIGVTHAIPYRAWSKTIERVFGTIETQWIRELPGWCGNGIDAKPETLLKDMRNGRLMTYEEFAAYWIQKILPEYHAYRSEGAAQSPMDIYCACEKARADVPSHATLAIAKMLRTERTVQTTGIRWENEWYWDDALARLVGEKVMVLYNRQDSDTVSVIHDGEFVCEAIKRDRLQLVGESRDRLEEHLRQQRISRRGVREALTMPRERVRQLNTMITESPDLAMPSSVSSLIHERTYKAQQEAKQQRAGAEERKARQVSQKMRSRWSESGAELLQKGG